MIFSFYYRHMLDGGDPRHTARAALTTSTDRCFRPTAGAVPSTGSSSRERRQTGVTLHHMVTKADAGDIVGQKVVPIERTDTAVILYEKLCDAAGDAPR